MPVAQGAPVDIRVCDFPAQLIRGRLQFHQPRGLALSKDRESGAASSGFGVLNADQLVLQFLQQQVSGGSVCIEFLPLLFVEGIQGEFGAQRRVESFVDVEGQLARRRHGLAGSREV